MFVNIICFDSEQHILAKSTLVQVQKGHLQVTPNSTSQLPFVHSFAISKGVGGGGSNVGLKNYRFRQVLE